MTIVPRRKRTRQAETISPLYAYNKDIGAEHPLSVALHKLRQKPPLEETTYRAIPASWKAQRAWVPYRAEERDDGRVDKKPFNWRTGDASYLGVMGTFHDAIDAARDHGGDGVGLTLGEDFVSFDFDAAIKDGKFKPGVEEQLRTFPDAYIEVSRSGSGLKVIMPCAWPPEGKPRTESLGEGDQFHGDQHVQYLSAGFTVVTGAMFQQGLPEVTWSTERITEAMAAFKLEPRGDSKPRAAPEWNQQKVEAALKWISPDVGYHEWFAISVILARYGGEEWQAIWEQWSSGELSGVKADSWDQHAQRKAREIVRASEQPGGLTLASLYFKARANGWSSSTEGTDLWFAEQAAATLEASICYVREDKAFAVWTGHHWRRNAGEEALRIVANQNLAAAGKVFARLNAESSDKDKAAAARVMLLAQKVPTARNVHDLLRADFMVDASEFDTVEKTGGLLNFTNGVLDLATGKLQEADPSLRFSTVVPRRFRRVPSKAWEKHLRKLLPKGDVRDAFRMGCGYALIGRNDGKAFFVLSGPANTGKSTTMEVIAAALGADMAETAKPKVFQMQRSSSDADSGHDVNMIPLVGPRFLLVPEPEAGYRWHEEKIKRWTGGDAIPMRGLYSSNQTYHPVGILFCTCNEMPRANAESAAFWDRLILLQFEQVQIKDDRVRARLMADLDGVVCWLVDAARDYLAARAEGRDPLGDAQALFRKERDGHQFRGEPVIQFLDDGCLVDSQGKVSLSELIEGARKMYGIDDFHRGPNPYDPARVGRLLGAKELRLERGRDKGAKQRFLHGFRLKTSKELAAELEAAQDSAAGVKG